MKWIAASVVCVCMVTPMGAGAQGDAVMSLSVQRQIEPLLSELTLAANAHDTDRFLATYLHDSTFVFVYNGVVVNGFDAVRAQQLKAWNNGKSDVVYSSHGAIEFAVLSPDIAVVVEPMAARRTLPGGQVSVADFAVTMIWQKRPEGWRIVQAHESTAH